MNPVILPAGTTLGKSYEYGIDVNLGTTASPVWQQCRRISAVNPSPTARVADAKTYDDQGADNSEVTGWSWSLAFTIQGNISVTTGLYLPEVEALLARADDATGEGAIIEVRWYHKPATGAPRPTAKHGFATVASTRQNTDADGSVEVFAITLTGKGSSDKITNPYVASGTPAVPTVTAVAPPARGTSQMVTITGTGLLGATDVKFGATSATSYTVVNDSTIVAVLPSGSAGAVNVTVVTAGGTSVALPYTRGA